MSIKLRYLYRALRYWLRVDPAELRYVGRRLRAGQVGVDVGCHKGAYTYWMRRRVGPAGEVIAFEPQPRQVEYLRTVFQSMHYTNVTLVPMGLSDTPGRLRLHIPTAAGATHFASFVAGRSADRSCDAIDVDVTTLDAFFGARPRGPDFLKIDVEGHELAVLEGGRRTLEAQHPTVLIECEARHRPDGDVRPVFERFAAIGYAGSFFHNGGRRPLAEFRGSEHQPPVSESGVLPSGYVNNFAFEHPSRM
ncbi:MAG: FkbM family methyltransferase [Pirellulales bacterium]